MVKIAFWTKTFATFGSVLRLFVYSLNNCPKPFGKGSSLTALALSVRGPRAGWILDNQTDKNQGLKANFIPVQIFRMDNEIENGDITRS